MIPILETPEIRHRALPISVQTWHRMQEQDLVSKRAELIRGVIVEKMSKSPLHTLLADQLRELLHEWAAGRYWVRLEQPLTLSDSEPEPDISVVTGSRHDYTVSHPSTALLVVEVCVSSSIGDREMLPLYASAGVSEVWLVLAATKQVERFLRPKNGAYQESQIVGPDEELSSGSLPGFALPLKRLFPS
ncbi:MAG TPA: Uma2 family endonuclease [Verrucomicrobiales bacterium]|jgi:Uma2 family endonuclease|nr:Uma2 family endonuclease [Verrucomicrobiales bacterium]